MAAEDKIEEGTIILAFQSHLGATLDEMDESDRDIYAPDYSMFKAGWIACITNGAAKKV